MSDPEYDCSLTITNHNKECMLHTIAVEDRLADVVVIKDMDEKRKK